MNLDMKNITVKSIHAIEKYANAKAAVVDASEGSFSRSMSSGPIG